MRTLPSLLLLTTALVSTACSSDSTSTTRQLISCETDPQSGTILSCQPGGGDGGEDSCVDVDEDGDGQPSDQDDGTILRTTPDGADDAEDDADCDGIPDEDDCDEQPGEVDLPYAVRPALGATVTPIRDAFDEKGAQPAAVLSVVFEDGGSWRQTELSTDTAFTITQEDCDHAGNRDVGRDRVFVTWQNLDGSTETDHLDIRYCDE